MSSTSADLRPAVDARLAEDRLDATEWGNGPGDRYLQHRHDYDKVLVCIEGSIDFGLPELERVVRMEPSDRLDLPSNTLHDAVVGRGGVRMLEAHLPPGTLPRHVLHRPGWGHGAN
jgi:hypothetical protein